jgi:GT2 family glycosyltransferase
MRAILSRVARAVYRLLPRKAQVVARSSLGRALFARRMRGGASLAADAAWAASARIPVSIVIPSYNDFAFLVKCLESVDKTCRAFDYEVLVVDDFCEPGNRVRLETLVGGRVRMIFRDQRGGFAKAVNSGIKEARYDVVLLNSDIVAQPGWLEGLQRAAHTETNVGLVSPMLVYPDGLIQYGGTYYARRLAPQWFGHLFVGRPANDPLANRPWFIRSVSGACVYIRREAMDALIGLDETYWLGFEDVDLGLRAWRAGFRCLYEPAAKLVHHESATRGYSQGVRELASMRYFWSKWSDMTFTRELPETPPITFLLSAQTSSLWSDYVRQLARDLVNAGRRADVREVEGGVDESVVSELEGITAIVVATDEGAAGTAWLATQSHGIPVYLLPGIEADLPGVDSSKRVDVVAGYRPEFEFISPNRWSADRLAALSAWESRAIIPPALRPVKHHSKSHSGVVTVGLNERARLAVADAAGESGAKILAHFDDAQLSAETLQRIGELSPRAIVSGQDCQHSLAPLALMSLGAAYIGKASERTRYEVLDGYNSLLYPDADESTMLQSLHDVLSSDDVWLTVSANGHATAMKMSSTGAHQIERAFADMSERAF